MIRARLIKNVAVILWASWRRRYLIAMPILILPIIGLAVGYFSPKQYETYTTILFQEAAKQNPFLEDLTVATNLKDRMAALNALLHSRHILAGVAVNTGMITEEMSEREKTWVISQLSQSLSARLVGSDLIKISYRAKTAEKITDILQQVSLRFVERVIAPQRSAIFKSEAFLKKELEQRLKDLEQSEFALADYKSVHASELPELHAGNVARLSTLRAQLAQHHTALEGAKASKASLLARLSQTNPVVGRIEEAIVNVMAELSLLRSRYTDKHSKVQSALRKLGNLQQERIKIIAQTKQLDPLQMERLWALASTPTNAQDPTQQPLLVSQLERFQQADDRLNSLTQEVVMLKQEIAQLSETVSGYGRHERQLNQLQREINVRRDIYQDLASRHQMARVTGALGKSEENDRVKLIDPPYPPSGPSNFPLIIYLIAGLVAGIGLGFGLALIAEVLDTSIRRKQQFTALTEIPVLVRIPPLNQQS